MSPKYPIYIVSKGRWESRLTSKSLERMKVFYYIIVEEQEYEEYTNVIDKEKVLILPKEYQLNYDVFNDEIGKGRGTGPGAARNFAWDHSIGLGAKRHWVLDDNIYDFYRLNRNAKNIVQTGTIFKCAEDFVDRYTNVLISGFNYCKFCLASEKYPPYLFNTRIYSTLLIDNKTKYRWRGRYNEDTDLSLRVLKDGDCTLQFNAFLQEKATTQRIRGGNSKEFYDEEGTLNKSKMLEEMHPDLARVTWRFNRWHHFVDYKPFKRNKPIKVEGLFIPKGINNYGMKMINIKELAND
jgi:hypothetical protein|tara:strand:+ start:89 stop:973 length:885 start_codon:yes stop_codon:yes gene_type:complete